MKILVACEESQTVTKEFRKLGHEAYSCDILPCSGGFPQWHIQDDVFNVIFTGRCNLQSGETIQVDSWDKKIAFPPCTDLAVSGARWFPEKRENGSQERSIRFFYNLWKYFDALENPIGILNGGKYIKKWFPDLYEEMVNNGFPFKPTQIIQPWQFGHGETKATCLWLRELPELEPTDIVEGREQRIWKMAPGEERGKQRSKTYPGIAKAMAEKWS